jgi:DNA-directed RNA polymerase specialized sigma24 family protein
MSFHVPQRRSPSDAGAPTERDESTADAFAAVHGARLHGFALLLLLGNRRLAGALAVSALSAAPAGSPRLSHPERAAAWLRARVLGEASHLRNEPVDDDVRLEALDPIGASPAVLAALQQLSLRQRAALIAHDVERLDRQDVATILHASDTAVARLLGRGRRLYLDAYASAAQDEALPSGPHAVHIAAAVESVRS